MNSTYHRTMTEGGVLFVCRQNIGRSQIAQLFWEQRGGVAASAGLQVDFTGQPLWERPEAEILIEVMKDQYKVDISDRITTRLEDIEQRLLNSSPLIIVMAEIEVVPPQLLQRPNTEAWSVRDLKDLSYIETVKTVEEIRIGVGELAARHGFNV